MSEKTKIIELKTYVECPYCGDYGLHGATITDHISTSRIEHMIVTFCMKCKRQFYYYIALWSEKPSIEYKVPSKDIKRVKRTKTLDDRTIKYLENQINGLKTFTIGKHRFWACDYCDGWHYGNIYKCPMRNSRAKQSK